jgi:hypothetical protein
LRHRAAIYTRAAPKTRKKAAGGFEIDPSAAMRFILCFFFAFIFAAFLAPIA